MDKKTEALKLALEALEESLGYVEEEAENAQRLYGKYPTRQARIQGLKDDARKHMDAITAIREALSEHQCKYPNCPYPCPDLPDCWDAEQPTRYATTIGEGNFSANGFEGDWFKKPAQPSKPWVPLTDDEIDDIYMGAGKHDLIRAREIETKLREKNS